MPAPYDLERHIRDILALGAQPQARPKKDKNQLEFELDVPTAVSLRRYETEQGLVVVEEEMAFARAISRHSIDKAFCVREYARLVGATMHGKFPALWWIELFCGPGRLYVRDDDEFIDGSPLEALGIPFPFSGYAFADLSNACTESLRKRVGDRPNVHIRRGNANDPELLVEIAALIPKNALVVLYGDQAGLDLEWRTIEFFIRRFRHLDLLLNVPVEQAVRAIAAGNKLADDRYFRKARAMLGMPPETQLPGRATFLRDYYHRRLADAGFGQIRSHTVQLTGRNRDLYDLILASRHPLAPKFFSEVVTALERRKAAA
jgi:three-Cys-motif partner protein